MGSSFQWGPYRNLGVRIVKECQPSHKTGLDGLLERQACESLYYGA